MSNAGCATKTRTMKEIVSKKGNTTVTGDTVAKGNRTGIITMPQITTETMIRDVTTPEAASAVIPLSITT